MLAPLLVTKLQVPPARARQVPRPELVACLQSAWHEGARVALLAAPPGFGKTTLVAAAARDSALPCAWLTLDEGDNDPASFWEYLVAALRQVQPDLGAGALALLRSPQPAPAEALAAALINDLAAWAHPLLLVLDDYHTIAAPAVHAGLAYFVDHLPSPVRVVLATRAEPPLPLGRWRARGHLREVPTASLRFTPAESAAFLRDTMGLSLSAGDTCLLAERAEGWAAGLQIAALALRVRGAGEGGVDMHAFLAAFAQGDRYLLDYLAADVLARQPESVQRFLAQTAVLDEITGPLCDAVTGGAGGAAQLEALERAGLFVVPLDEARRWFRYHRLFAEVLRRQFDAARAAFPDLPPAEELHRRAGTWYERQKNLPAAMAHFLKAQDYARAADLLEPLAWPAIQQGEHATLRHWLERLPDALLHSRPQLCLMYAWALMLNGEVEAYARPLAMAEAAWRAEANRGRLGEVVNLQANMAAARGEHDQALALAQQALEWLPANDAYNRGLSLLFAGSAHLTRGDVVAAWQAFTAGRDCCTAGGNRVGRLSADNALGQVLLVQGRLHAAARHFADVQREVGQAALFDGLSARLLLGELRREWDDLDTAERDLRAALAACREAGMQMYALAGYLSLARVQYARGAFAPARALLAEAVDVVRRAGDRAGERQALALDARLALAAGDRTAVARWRRDCGLAPDDPASYTTEWEHLVLARMLIAEGVEGARAAVPLLQRLADLAQAQLRGGSVIEIDVLRVLALHALGHDGAAGEVLVHALALAEPEGYVRVFADEGPVLAGPLRKTLERGSARGYVQALIAACMRAEQLPATPEMPEPLTARELEVLRCLAAGLSNREIAQRLCLTLNTVKAHAKHIYAKLEAGNRTQALRRARALGLPIEDHP